MEIWSCPFFDYHHRTIQEKKKQVKISYWRILLPQRALCKILTRSKFYYLSYIFPLISFIKLLDTASGSSVTVTVCTYPRNLKSGWHTDKTRVLTAVKKPFPLHQLTQALMHSDPVILKLYCENELTGNLVKNEDSDSVGLGQEKSLHFWLSSQGGCWYHGSEGLN